VIGGLPQLFFDEKDDEKNLSKNICSLFQKIVHDVHYKNITPFE